uniref:G-protein coupled bile acid receptor 1 n=1 Tax=Pogona vitticeps TaxID=103695 RepID=A0A6J0UN01_9SAUR
MEQSDGQAKNKTQELLIAWLSQPLSVIIILANIFLILGILFNRKLHGTTNWCFLSLLFADLLAGSALPCIPKLATEMNLKYYPCFFTYLTPNFLFLCLLANLLVVHYAKYVCIIHPLHYQASWVYRWAFLYILLAWTAPLIFACLPLVWNQWGTNKNCSFKSVFPKPYLYLETYGLLIPSILAMSFMCIQILWVARKHLKDIKNLLHSVTQSQAPSELEQQLELRNVKSIASASIIFLVCWVPYIVCLNISLLATTPSVSQTIRTIVTCIGTGSAAAVPIILSFGNHQYTQFWRDLATKVCQGCCQRWRCKQKQAQLNASMPRENICMREAHLREAPG